MFLFEMTLNCLENTGIYRGVSLGLVLWRRLIDEKGLSADKLIY